MLPCCTVVGLAAEREGEVQTEVDELPGKVVAQASFEGGLVVADDDLVGLAGVGGRLAGIGSSVIEIERLLACCRVDTCILVAVETVVRLADLVDADTADDL